MELKDLDQFRFYMQFYIYFSQVKFLIHETVTSATNVLSYYVIFTAVSIQYCQANGRVRYLIMLACTSRTEFVIYLIGLYVEFNSLYHNHGKSSFAGIK